MLTIIYTVAYYFVFALFFLYAVWQLYYSKFVWRRNLPPGTMGLPLIGHTVHFLSKKFKLFDDFHALYGDVFKTHLLGKPTIRVRGADGIAVILKGGQRYTQSLWPKSTRMMIGELSVSMSRGEVHRVRKARMAKLLSPKSISASFDVISDIIQRHLLEWSRKESVALYPALSKMFVDIILGVSIGKQGTDLMVEKEARIMSDSAFCLPFNLPGTQFRKGLKARGCMKYKLSDIIDDIMNGNIERCPLAEILAEERNGDILTCDYVTDLLIELINNGRETSTSAASNLIINIARNVSVLGEIRRELRDNALSSNESEHDVTYEWLRRLKYVDWTIREVLRLRPPIGGGFRTATRAFDVQGFHVPKDWTVVYSIRNTHESQAIPHCDKFIPDRWRHDNPHRPDRTRFAYVPFGGGNRACPGRYLASIVLRLFLVHFARGYGVRLLNGDFGPVKGMTTPRPSDTAQVRFYTLPHSVDS